MRVLIVSQYYWPENFRINDVAKTLVGRGIAVEVLTGKPNYPAGKVFDGYRTWGCQSESRDGISIHRIPLLARGQGGCRLALNYASFVMSGTLLAPWLLRRKKFDVIFVYAPSPILQAIPAIFLGWLKKCSSVLWVQDLWPESLEATGYVRNRLLLRCVESVVRFIYRHTDLILVQSRAFVPQVRRLNTDKPIRYFPNSVETMFCNPPEVALPEVAALESGFSVVFAGNVGTAQAVEVIIEAASLLKSYPDIRFVVFGQGSRWQWMRDEIDARKLNNVHLPGRFPIETMPGLMSKASGLLVTLSDQPIFAATVPNKVQAYMAAARPILACLNGEGACLVKEAEAGLAVPAEDGKALADAILHLYAMDPDERTRLGQNGRRYYQEHFDHDRLVEMLIGYLQEISQLRGH